ncbi:MAG: hypothetical protein HN742_14840 [Lentisphaerae bacterium]|jgi:hypothetical protein|nr:hypothetical protein [Lentisphaerota bacterium]MBT4818621.1 hypothetical protein [Lentisphaerota bacterium]MBT5609539.1 hypothetical protein [Lentisphaerota bacterium]MBT7058445.1 hypothetical protein [Lentisphaerota bacterium]MBT7843154.1 hypothetical protein [Lentisphaerota bacterium]
MRSMAALMMIASSTCLISFSAQSAENGFSDHGVGAAVAELRGGYIAKAP